MTTYAAVFGFALVLLGIAAYALTGGASLTALIPSFVGALMAALGWLGRRESLRRHAMHAASAVGLLGFLGSMTGIPQVVAMLRGDEVARPEAAVTRTIMALVCAAFVGLAVRSFIAARRSRSASS